MDKTEFTDSYVWKIIDQALRSYRLELMDDLRAAPLASVDRIRGALDGIDWVQALPETLFREKHDAREERTAAKIHGR